MIVNLRTRDGQHFRLEGDSLAELAERVDWAEASGAVVETASTNIPEIAAAMRWPNVEDVACQVSA